MAAESSLLWELLAVFVASEEEIQTLEPYARPGVAPRCGHVTDHAITWTGGSVPDSGTWGLRDLGQVILPVSALVSKT